MQPLSPAERRFLERMKNDISMGQIVKIDFNGQDMTNEEKLGYKELWLKVLTMALECNEALAKCGLVKVILQVKNLRQSSMK